MAPRPRCCALWIPTDSTHPRQLPRTGPSQGTQNGIYFPFCPISYKGFALQKWFLEHLQCLLTFELYKETLQTDVQSRLNLNVKNI